MKKAVIIQRAQENSRVALGISLVEDALRKTGYEISRVPEKAGEDYRALEGMKI